MDQLCTRQLEDNLKTYQKFKEFILGLQMK